MTHTVCETCWFDMQPDRYPTQVIRESGDFDVDTCCRCGRVKLTRIYVRSAEPFAFCDRAAVHDE